MGAILVGALSLVLGAVGWHLTTCTSERRETLLEFRKAFTKLRAVGERLDDANAAFDFAEKSLTDYLSQDDVQLDQITLLQSQFAASAKNIAENCNSVREALDEYEDVRRELLKYYGFRELPEDVSERGTCSYHSRFAADLDPASKPHSLERLARDNSFRNELVRDERYYIDRNSKLTAGERQANIAWQNSAIEMIKALEERDDSLMLRVRDCLSLVFRK